MTEWNAAEYNRRSGLQKMIAEEQLAHLPLLGTERVLDIGCGDGKITAQIAARVPQGSVLGVDSSKDMIRFAADHFGPEGQPNLHFEVADVRSLPYQQQFDLVISFNALHWVPEQQEALHSIRRALRPDGKALLKFVPAGRRKSIEDVIEEVRKSAPWANYFTHYTCPYVHSTPEQYSALAEACGLRVLSIHVEEKAWDFQTRAIFAAYCRVTLAAWTCRLPESEWSAFIDEVLERYFQVAADTPEEANTFKFYQMAVFLEPKTTDTP